MERQAQRRDGMASALNGAEKGWRKGLPSPIPPAPFQARGRHRKVIEIERLNRQIRFLQEELEALEGLEPASNSCKELVEFTLTRPDPLLPIVRGQVNEEWDRWTKETADDVKLWRCCGMQISFGRT